MKIKLISIPRLTLTAIATGSLCFVGSLRAQQNTSVSDNPHLRAKDEPTKTETVIKKLSDKDVKFIQEAASDGVQEVADGKAAEERGQSAEVKRIGGRMVADHSKANNQLLELAKKKGVSIDMSKGKARPFESARFDRQYLVNTERDHETDIKAFEREASSGDDADVKTWAAKTLPTLKSHLAMVKDARKKVN